MKITFNYLKFRNVRSYGALEQVVDFKHGINLISGHNGAGKTTILEALSYCLFGRPFTDITLPRMLNRRIKKGLYTECGFTVNDNEFVVTRTMKPDSIKIMKNGVEQQLKSAKKLIQNEIDRIIGINHYMFHHAISLAINVSQPFISMKASDKREVVDNIFNIVVFAEMTYRFKLKKTDITTRLKVANDKKSYIEFELSNLRTSLQAASVNVAQKSEEWNQRIQNNTTQINIINERITNAQARCDSLITRNDQMFRLYPSDKFNEMNNDIGNATRTIIELKTNMSAMHTKLNFLRSHNECPQCGQEITAEMKDDSDIGNTMAGMSDKIGRYEAAMAGISQRMNEFNLGYNEIRTNQNEVDMIRRNMDADKNTISSLHNDIQYSQSMIDNVVVAETDMIENSIKSKTVDIETSYTEIDAIARELRQVEKAISLISESGIKAYFLEKLIPMLNSRINTYLESFNLPAIVTFDNLLDVTIKTIDDQDDNDYSTFSAGEKKRIDIAIFMSFIDVTKRITDWDCNILIFDEIFDTSMDDDGIEDVMRSLRNVVSNESSVYVISHRAQNLNKNLFDRILRVEKQGSFSNIVEE